ncbi:MAG TPA: cyclic pyranopterin monophosphate synthase MoaC, partial [Dokdonella sp.]
MKKIAPQQLTHLSSDGRPRMVDVGDKIATRREAVSEVRVRFPAEVA